MAFSPSFLVCINWEGRRYMRSVVWKILVLITWKLTSCTQKLLSVSSHQLPHWYALHHKASWFSAAKGLPPEPAAKQELQSLQYQTGLGKEIMLSYSHEIFLELCQSNIKFI